MSAGGLKTNRAEVPLRKTVTPQNGDTVGLWRAGEPYQANIEPFLSGTAAPELPTIPLFMRIYWHRQNVEETWRYIGLDGYPVLSQSDRYTIVVVDQDGTISGHGHSSTTDRALRLEQRDGVPVGSDVISLYPAWKTANGDIQYAHLTYDNITANYPEMPYTLQLRLVMELTPYIVASVPNDVEIFAAQELDW